MAADQKEKEKGGEVIEGDQQEETYQQKFQDMQKYIPFLEMMIQRLERSSDKSREAQLIKMKSLLSILSNTKKKLKISTLERCEDVLQKLHDKVEKGITAQTKPSGMKSEEKVTTSNSQESSNSGISDNASSSDGNEQNTVTSSSDASSVTSIMKTLQLAAANTSGKSVSSATPCPVSSSDLEGGKDELMTTASSSVDKISSPEKKNKALDVFEQSRERLKKLMEQQSSSLSAESGNKLDGHSSSLSVELQYQADPPWQKQDHEKRAPKSVYSHSTVAGVAVEDCSRLERVKDISSSEGPQYDDEHYNSVDISRSLKHDESYAGWSDYKPPAQCVRPADSEQHRTVQNKPLFSPSGCNRVPASPHSPTSPHSAAANSGKQACTSPVKRALPQFPALYNVLKHPPAAGSKPLSDADIEELLEDTKRSEPEPEKKEEPMHMSLRAKLEQEIQQVHRVGVSKGGALRSLVQKDEKLKSPVRNILDIMKPSSEPKKDKLMANRQQASSKSDSITGSALKANHDKEKGNDISQSRQNSGSHFAEKGENKNDFANVNDTVIQPTIIKDKRPTDPRRHAGFSPRREEVCQNSSGEDVHTSVGEKNYPCSRPSTVIKSNIDGSSSNNRDLSVHSKSEGTAQKEGAGILSSMSKEELQKIVEENLRNLPSPPPNTKEILETVNMNSPASVKSSWQQSTDFISPHTSPLDYKQSGFMMPLHSSQYGSQAESHLGNGRNSASYSSAFGGPRPEDRRGLLPTPNIPLDPRILPRNLNQDPRCSRDNQGLSNIHDPRLNTSNYPHRDNFRSGIAQHTSHDQYMRPVPTAFHQNSRTHFHTNQSQLPASSRWGGTACYGVLSHNSPRPPDETFVLPEDSYSHHGANSSRYQCSPHSSQHEFRQIHSLHDQFSDQLSGNHQQHPSWQSPPSSQGFRSGSSADYPSSVRSVGQPVQHHGSTSHSVSKIPVGDPRLCNQFTGHRSPMTPQNMTSAASSRGSGGTGTLSHVQSAESRSASTLSERDPRRRRSIEEPEKRDCSPRSSRDIRNISSGPRGSNYGFGPERVTDRRNSNERRRENDSKKFESISCNRRRSSPEPKETELVSPLNSLYDAAAVPKTGKGYGFQKFRIPKIKRPPSPPKSKSPPPPKAKSPPPKLESSHVGDTKEKVELVKPNEETPLIKTETMPCGLKVDASNDVPDNDATDDDKIYVEGVIYKDSENALPEKSYDIESDNRSAGSRSKEEVTQEWIEALIRKSFESGEGKKYIEQAKLLEKLGESLKGKKLRKIKQILESDSESDDSVLETSKKKEESTYLEKEDQKTEEKEKQLKKAVILVERSNKSKCRRVILSDDDDDGDGDGSTDSEALASRLKKEGTVDVDRPLSTTKGKDKLEKEDKSSRVVEGGKSKKEKQSTATGDAKPVKKYSKRRSALELLQEDIRDMFICEGVVTATGHRMCRLLKETPPGMTVDEISKSTVKRTEDEVSTAAEESDGSSVCKRRSRKLVREKEFDKKGREEKVDRKQKTNIRMKDEETGCGFETVSEMNEKVRSSRLEKKDDSHMDETDSPGSPVTKARKKCEKSKWKGYVIEESEDSNEDVAVDKVDNNKERTQERKAVTSSDKPPGKSYSHGRTRSKQNPTDDSETSNSEHGKRARLPRVILEKADISKLSLMSSKPRTKYFEDSSSEGESVIEDSTLSPVCSVKSRFKVVQKPRAKVKHVLHKRGRRCVSKRGRKKCLKIDGNDEASTDVESIVSDQSSVASSVSHHTNWENTCSPIGFMFQRKCIRKRSKLLGKKIDDIINRLTKDADGCKVTDITVNNSNSEGKPSESGEIDSNGEGVVAEIANIKVKEKENVKHEGTSESATSKTDLNLAKSYVKTENTGASKAGRKRNSRIMLSLVRKFGVQKKIKKKKTKWQLGIINSPKKKGGIKIGTKDVAVSASSEKEVNDVNKTVSRTNHSDESNSANEGERDVSTKECVAEDDKLVSSIQKVTVGGDNSEKKIDMKQIIELEDNKNAEVSDICVNKSADEVMVVSLNSGKTVARRKKSPAVVDKSYVLDGSAKYACKLCSAQCKSIVSHYKNFHQESEVLISRLPEEEATRAIAEASESNYKEEEGTTKTGKRTRKQAGIFICRICNYSATFAINFYEHLSSHTGEYRFKCGECKYEAPTRHSIKGHFYYRHPELKGVDGVSITVLAPGSSNDAKFVFGYLCSSCNYIQLLKHNIERHISLRHASESHAKFICINMSKVVKSPNDTAASESNNVCADEGTNGSSGYVGDKVLLGDENISDENMCKVISPVTETEIIPEEGIQRLSSSVTRIDVTEQEPKEKHTDMITKPCDTVVESCMGKEQISEIEPLGVVCVTQSDNFADSCTLTSGKPSNITVVGMKPDTVSKEKPDTVSQESSALNSADMAIKAGDAKLPSEIAKEDLVDVEERQMKQKIDGSVKKDEHADTTTGPESGAEEAMKEVDLKAFVCSDDLEEENSVIQKERLKKMEEIAKNLKDSHPQFLQSSRSLILDHLSDKLKTGFRSKTHATAVVERNDETVDSVTNSKESESGGCKSQPEMVGDVSTLIDEKRAIEAAQAVQNLLRAEKETVEHEQSPSIGRKVTDSSGSRSGRHAKPCSSDAVERRITRSFSKNGDDVDTEGVDESSSDISFGFEAEDNDEIAEYESQSPETLLNETLSALKDVGPEKSRSRMFNIIERLASKVVPKTEPADVGDLGVEMDVLKPHGNVIATDDDNVCSDKEIGLGTSETGCLKNVINKKWGAIGKPPPLISLEATERNGLQSNTGIEHEGAVSSVRVGPLEVRRFSDGLLYSCCIRGCIFASTSRMSFASHIELNHKISRWDGSCRACNTQAKGDRSLRLSHALRHLIEFHLVASPDDLSISSASNVNEQDILTSSTEKTYVEEREVSAENTRMGGGEMPTEQSHVGQEKFSAEETYMGGEDTALEKLSVEQGEMSTESTSVGEGENCNRNEGATVDCQPRKFIRPRRLSGDLLSVPKPAEDSLMPDAQQQALRKDDMEFNQLLRDWDEDDSNNNEDSGPFLKIESVVSLNPEAMGTEDVNEILKAVEDTQDSSKLPEKSDSGDCSNVVTSSPTSSFCTVPSAAVVARSIIESSMPFMTTTADSSTNVLQTSSPDVQLLSASSSSSSSALPISLLRGNPSLPPGTVHMIPMTQLPKSSTITILPSLQPMKLSNVQLSPVKLANFKSPDITSKPSVSTNIPHSLVGLAQITRPTNSKLTVAKERHSTGVWCNQVLPNILPKGTFVRVEIKDNQITTTTPVVLTTKSQAPVVMSVKAAPSLTMATKTTTSVPKAPISSVSAMKGLEVQVAATKAPQKGRPSSGVLPPPPVPVTPASNTVLTTVISKNKLPHKTAVAPSYAKASKVPSAYKEMIKPAKLRHLYKCMGRLCCYTTDRLESFARHYNEHEIELQQQIGAERRKRRPPESKISDWQQCAYCCAMQTSLEGLLNHIRTEHAHCLYQCAYCFYRAVTKSYVVLHQNTSHTNEHVAVLMCKDIRSQLKPASTPKCSSSVVIPYVCEQGNCGATFYIPDSFLRHLEKEHSQLAIYSCHMCQSKSLKPDRLLAHYKLHSCCFYQCLYCLHGTDTKEEMHHHLCNFHPNQIAKVVIRASRISEDAVVRGSRNEQDLLKALNVLDLDEGISDDGMLLLPPPEKEQTTEDFLEDVTQSELQESASPNITDGNLNISAGLTTKDVASYDETVDTVPTISSEISNIPTDLLLRELTKETNKRNDANTMKSSDCAGVVGSDDKMQSWNPTASGVENKNDDIVVIDDDGSGVSHGSDQSVSSTQPVQPIPHQNSHASSEVCVQPSGMDPSQSDSDVESIVKPGSSQQEDKELNGTRESDVIVLDSTTDTESEGTEIMGKDLATKENTHLILHEPLVTVKHRNPRTTLAIEAAVDPLSLELPQQEGETSNVTSSLQSTSSISLCAENPHLDSENINSTVSSTERGLNECGASGVDDDDVGLSGSLLYHCGYVTCAFTAEDSSLLKDHLLVCDLARASSSLTCVHCKKQFKYVSSLIEHLRTHGTRRFRCALCSFRAPAPQQVVKHMKQRHRVGSTRIAPLDPLSTDPETAIFVVFPKDKGRGGRRGSGKDTHDVRSKSVFLPEEVEILPRQAIYTRPVRCATCSYTTKVRSNMTRHLHLHLTSTSIPDVTPPNNAPVNPVPCLEKKEMMFDKMTNLAASSHIAAGTKASETPSGSVMLTEEMEAKLPKFVPEPQRYVCGAPGCSYLTCDETMLRYHLRALHFDEPYRCPHCPASTLQDNMGQIVSIERMGAHLKMHDSRLYKCAHCMYHHFQRYVVERHLADKHPEKRPFVHVVREPEVESGSGKTEGVASTSLEGAANSVGAAVVKNPWHCGLCKFQCSTRSEVLEHTCGVHGLKSQFKCGLCSYRSSSKASFDAHFGSKHPASGNVELIHVYFKVDAPHLSLSPAAKSGLLADISSFDTTPLWRRDMQRVRHIRGILLEEEGDVPKPDIVRRSSVDIGEMEEAEGKFGSYGKPIGNLYFCTLCNKYRTKFRADFRDHLYRELSYHKWVCTHCSLMSCNKSTLQKHSAKVHEKDRKPEAIAPLTPNEEIEEWVDKVLSTQLAVMKAEQHAASGESASFSVKASGAGLTNQTHPGPSGLSGRSSKAGHGVPGSGRKVSMLEKEDVLGSSCDDTDIGTSKKKVSGVRDLASTNPTDSKTCDGSPYTKMKVSDEVKKVLSFPCKHCNMKFAQIRGLKVHIRHNHLKLSIWTCGHCGYVANSEESVFNHSKVEHPDLPPRPMPHTKGSCVKLDDEFWQREYGLGQGSESKYSSSSTVTPSSSVTPSPAGSPIKKRQRSCSPANESEGSVTSLSLADQSVNKCMYCDYYCRSASDLKYHVMRHWVQKPFKCGYCDFEGVREYEIKKHSAKIHPLKKLRVIEKPMPSQPDIRPLQRNKRSKPDSPGSSSDTSVTEVEREKVMQCDESPDTDVVSTVQPQAEEEQQNTVPVPNLFCCFYCPQRGTSVVSIHQHWQEKHKNKLMGPNGVIRLGLPFKYKEVNMKQFLKGKNVAAGRRPAFQCSYCRVRGTLSVLEAHQKTAHSDRPFRVSEARFTHYECAECHYIAFTVNTLKKHFEMDHAGMDLRYLVRSSKASTVPDVKSNVLLAANKAAVNLALPGPSSIVTAKYMCLWCEETCDSENTIQVHHAMCHSHLQFRYSVEKSSTPASAANISKTYSCPSCNFMSDSSQSMSEHLQHHVKPSKTDYKASDSSSKNHNHVLVAHAKEDCEVIQVEDAEEQLEKLRSDSGFYVGGGSGMKFDTETYGIPSPAKRLCVARKSTTLSPRFGKFHSVARKSTTPLPSQTVRKILLESYDVEQGDTSAPSSRSESPVTCSEFSYYATCPAPVDTHRITASVKLQNDLGVNMNVSLATMEKFTNLYPVVKVRDLKYEKWNFL